MCVTARPRYLQRTVAPTSSILQIYKRFDHRIRSTLADLLGEELGPVVTHDPTVDCSARQAALPIKWGVLGLGDLSVTAPAAYLECWFQIAPLISSRFSFRAPRI